MKLGVCEAPMQLLPRSGDWQALAEAVRAAAPDLFLLNEMPFGDWIANGPERDPEVLERSHRLHAEGLDRLGDLQVPTVLSSQAVLEDHRSVNQGYVWNAQDDVTPIHTKQFFPNEEGYYEARWYDRGEQRFEIGNAGGVGVGFLICTDVMFLEWARYYGRHGADLLLVPRATPLASLERWKTVIAAAAIVSGCYVASSNRSGTPEWGIAFGGRGWIFDPWGDLLAETSSDRPVVTAEIDLAKVQEAKREYPRYVEDLPASASR
jgi:N-carbamoylputrescine amidase